MAVTAHQQESLVALTTVMFNAPPGAEFLAEFEGYLEQGQSLSQIAVNLAATEAFNAQFAGMQGNDAKIDKVLLGLGIDQDSAAYQEAFTFFDSNLAAARNAGEILVEAGEFLYSTDDATFAKAASTFHNKIDAGVYHSVTLGLESSSVEQLQQAIANVTSDATTVTQAQRQLDTLNENNRADGDGAEEDEGASAGRAGNGNTGSEEANGENGTVSPPDNLGSDEQAPWTLLMLQHDYSFSNSDIYPFASDGSREGTGALITAPEDYIGYQDRWLVNDAATKAVLMAPGGF